MKFIKKLGSMYLLAVLAFGLLFSGGLASAEEEVDDITPPSEVIMYNPDLFEPKDQPDYSAGWDLVKQDMFYARSFEVGTWNAQYTSIAYSTGDNYQIKVFGHTVDASDPNVSKQIEVRLWEDDGATGDDPVKTWYIKPSLSNQYLTITNADSFKDGVNLKAEFYVQFTVNYSTSTDKINVNQYD